MASGQIGQERPASGSDDWIIMTPFRILPPCLIVVGGLTMFIGHAIRGGGLLGIVPSVMIIVGGVLILQFRLRKPSSQSGGAP